MNHVWTPIAVRTPCIRTRAAPLVQLFNGFPRCQSNVTVRPAETIATITRRTLAPRRHTAWTGSGSYAAAFSTSPFLPAKRGKWKAKDIPASNPLRQQDGSQMAREEAAASFRRETEGPGEKLWLKHGAEQEMPIPPEELTWRDYAPEGGMPLGDRSMTEFEVDKVFGPGHVPVDTANYVLNVVNWRRQSGALIDVGIGFPEDSGVEEEVALIALEYIRKLDPGFDEQEAGRIWAEEESQRMSAELLERAVKLGIYKRDPSSDTHEEEKDWDSQDWTPNTEKSALQAMRAEGKAKYEKQEAAKKQEEQKQEIALLNSQRGPLELSGGLQPAVGYQIGADGGIVVSKPRINKTALAQEKAAAWKKYYEDQAMIIKDNIIPEMTVLQRLGPSALVLFVSLGLCYLLSQSYTPAPKSARMFPDIPPGVATLLALTAANCFTFILCRYPPFYRTSSKYFTVVAAYPYALSLLGSVFRHDTFRHLASNLVSLWLFGLFLHEDVGRGNFLAIYFASGVLGNYVSLIHSVRTKLWAGYAFGMSGCVSGVLAAACALRGNTRMQILGYDLPVNGWIILALAGVPEIVMAARGSSLKFGMGVVDHFTHVGGLATGVAGALYLRSKAAAEKKAREDKGGVPSVGKDIMQAEKR